MEVGTALCLVEPGGKVPDIAPHLGADEGVHGRRGEALEFAELGRYGCRVGDERFGELFEHDLAGALFVARIDVGKQETHADRLDPPGLEGACGLAHGVLVQWLQHLAARRRQAFAHHCAVPPAHQRAVLPRNVLHDRIVLRALVAADMQDVAIAAVGDHAGPGAVMLEHSVGRNGGAVEDVIDGGGVEMVARAQFAQSIDRADRGIVGRGRHFVNQGDVPVGVGEYQIGKGAADIDPDQLHIALLPGPIRAAPADRARQS